MTRGEAWQSGAAAAVLCCDLGDEASCKSLQAWADEVRLVCGAAVLFEVSVELFGYMGSFFEVSHESLDANLRFWSRLPARWQVAMYAGRQHVPNT